jgi:MFS family permease
VSARAVAAAPDGPAARARLAVALAAATTVSVGMWFAVLALPAVERDLGLDRGAASLPYTATMLGFAAGNLLIGRLVDRFAMGAVLAAATLAQAAGFALAALAPDVWTLSAAHGLAGAASAAAFGPLMADVSRWFVRRRGLAVSVAATGNYLAGALWPLVLTPVLAADGWRAACWLVAGVLALAAPAIALGLRGRPPEPDLRAGALAAPARALTAAGLSPRALQGLLAVAGIGCCVAMSMPQVHIVAMCVGLGYGPAAGAGMLSVMLAGGVVSRIVSGLVADRLGGVRTLMIGSGLQMAALFLYLPFDGLVPLYVVSAVFGLAQGGIVPAYALIVRAYLPAAEAGRRVGAVIMATVLGMALGGWLSGEIYDATGSYAAAFWNGIAWNAVNLGAMAVLLGRSRGPRAAVA